MRILVVEDEPRLRHNLAKALREEGYAVDTAEDGDEGYFKADTYEYSAIVLDVMMPVMDGWQMLERLRRKKGKDDDVGRISLKVLLGTGRIELSHSTHRVISYSPRKPDSIMLFGRRVAAYSASQIMHKRASRFPKSRETDSRIHETWGCIASPMSSRGCTIASWQANPQQR